MISVLVKCGTCGRHVARSDLVVYGYSSICAGCAADHMVRVERFARRSPTACDVCHRPIKDLPEMDGRGNVRMYMHIMDGAIALLCERCSRVYSLKRRDLYGKTPWLRKHTGEV